MKSADAENLYVICIAVIGQWMRSDYLTEICNVQRLVVPGQIIGNIIPNSAWSCVLRMKTHRLVRSSRYDLNRLTAVI